MELKSPFCLALFVCTGLTNVLASQFQLGLEKRDTKGKLLSWLSSHPAWLSTALWLRSSLFKSGCKGSWLRLVQAGEATLVSGVFSLALILNTPTCVCDYEDGFLPLVTA